MIAHGLVYTQTSNIHEIVFPDMRNETMTAFGDQLKAIIMDHPEGEVLRLLLHTPAIPAVQHMIGEAQKIRSARPTMPKTRIAVVYLPSLQLSILNMAVRALVRSSTIKLFQKKDEAEAREWLLK
jgi:hypothetical protein